MRTLVDVGMEASAEIHYELDYPYPDVVITGDVVPVSGWALVDGFAPHKIEILVDNAPSVPARVRLPRLDVAKVLLHCVEASTSGFEAKVPLTLPPGEHNLHVRIRMHGQFGEWTSPPRRFMLRTNESDRQSEQLRTDLAAYSRRTLAQTAVPRNPRHLFVFSHSLLIGGGSLWLQELLSGLIKNHGWTATMVTALDGPLRSECESLGIPVHVTQPCDPSTVAGYEGQVAELALLAKASGAGAALVNTLNAFIGADAAKRAGIATSWTLHESFSLGTLAYQEWPNKDNRTSGFHPAIRARWEQVLGEVDSLLYVADATKEMFEPYSSARKAGVIRYGTPWVGLGGETSNRAREEARSALGLPRDATVVLNVGLMEPRKGQIALIAAAEQARLINPDLVLVIVGYLSSDYGLAVKELVTQSGLDSWVKLIDVCPDPLPWFQAANLFVNSSDIESLPRSILEAVCCGLPVVASDVFGTREIITDGVTGWLFEPNDVNALTVGLLRALETSPATRRKMAATAYQQMENWLDPQSYVAEYSRVLSELAQENGR